MTVQKMNILQLIKKKEQKVSRLHQAQLVLAKSK